MRLAGYSIQAIAERTRLSRWAVDAALTRVGLAGMPTPRGLDWRGTGVSPAPKTRLARGECSQGCVFTSMDPEELLQHLADEHGVPRVKPAAPERSEDADAA
jgi:hypothetical protein